MLGVLREKVRVALPERSTPAGVLLITTAGIFIAELVAMVVIYLLPPLPYAVQTMIDAAIMTTLIFPLLYFLSFRQLLNHVERHAKNEKALQQSYSDLQTLTHAEMEQRRWAEALAEAAGALNESLNLEEVLSRILTQIGRVTPYHAAAVLLLEGQKVTVMRHRGFASLPESVRDYEQRGFEWDAFPSLMRVRNSGEALFVPDIEAYSLRAGMPGFEWVQSFMIAPVRHEGALAGLIVLLGAARNFFDISDFTHLLSFTAHAEIAISNARLFEREWRARELANVLRSASIALAQSLDLEVVCSVALEYAARLAPFDRAGVVLLEGEERLVERAASARRASDNGGAPVLSAVGCRMPFGPGEAPLVTAMLKKQESELIEDTGAARGWRRLDDGFEAGSWLGVPLFAGGKTIGLLSLEKLNAGAFSEENIHSLEALAAQTAVTIQKAWLFEQVRMAGERLQSLSRRLVEIQETERNYVARELHDEAGQALAALTVDLRVMEQRVHEPAALLATVAKMDATLQTIISNLHRLAMALRPAALDHVGLEAAVRQQAEDVGERYGLDVRVAWDSTVCDLPKNVETTLYRIVQEALTNAVRHAHAAHVDVLLQRRGADLVLVVEDDGVGFDPEQAVDGEQLGLLGMRERAEMLAGHLFVESAPGKGASILVEIPYGDSHPDC